MVVVRNVQLVENKKQRHKNANPTNNLPPDLSSAVICNVIDYMLGKILGLFHL